MSCEDCTLAELTRIEQELLCHRDEAMVAQYADGRAAKGVAVAEQLDYARAHPQVTGAIRDASCHSIAMMWTHHLSAPARHYFHSETNLSLPLLPLKGAEEYLP
jgi:hypothetical protein